MISKNVSARLYGVLLATMYAFVLTLIAYGFWPRIPFVAALTLIIVLWIGIYFTGLWTILYRPKEFDKKIPISSKELRRRRKQFYDELDSLGRR